MIVLGRRSAGATGIRSGFHCALILFLIFTCPLGSSLICSTTSAWGDISVLSEKKTEPPGWIAGNWMDPPLTLFRETWRYRCTTYEILFSDSTRLAAAIYGLAVFTGDVPPDMDIDRFLRGAQGFHYTVGQIIDWAGGTNGGHTSEERTFLKKIIEDKVILYQDGRFLPGGRVTHVLGAAKGRKRSLALNLNHERIHVYWDENLLFKAKWLARWESLSPEERQEAIDSLKGYNQEDELSLIEEWSVRQNEQNPFGGE